MTGDPPLHTVKVPTPTRLGTTRLNPGVDFIAARAVSDSALDTPDRSAALTAVPAKRDIWINAASLDRGDYLRPSLLHMLSPGVRDTYDESEQRAKSGDYS